ncbi:OmpA family protein [Burkholderia sp. Bp8998]|uniref:OmpA family protein n=1 Tax=Burkholderia sp. Bp8998 TaxID=2184557 RepID=UPI000F5978C5|nr:OmpA family protein [Burkholderia sp. Bp8998]RQS19456.1 OmpA family protein [Burkholderia sp. Bp8998]
MYKAMFCIAALAALVGCSSSSGPTFSAWSVDRQDGQKTYRVSCYGLLEGKQTCYDKAREICHDQPVRPVQDDAPLGSTTSDGKPNTRLLTFQCGAPAATPAAAATPAPAPAPVAPAPRRVTLSGDANFGFNQAALASAATARLDKLVADAKGMTYGTVGVNGYTDDVGANAYNLRLSEQRAQAVARYLQAHGLNARHFDVHGYGEADPVATNSTAEGRARNRRVEIVLPQD